MDQKPSVGRIVHYWPHPDASEPWAAIIAGIAEGYDGRCWLHAFPPNGPAVMIGLIPVSPSRKVGYWTWPAKV